MELDREQIRELKRLANRARRLTLESVYHAGAGHIGGPLSATEMLVALFFHTLRVDPANPRWEDRDRFIMSKGHSAIGLYAVMALRGYFPIEELRTFDALDSRLQGHPDMSKLPGLDMSTGSLGQGLSPGVGMALGAKIRKKDFLTYVMIGDGDAQEGQIWEASAVAARYQLDNLVGLLDYNRLQQYGWAGLRGYKSLDRLPPLENPRAKWESFGWYVLEIDGHSFADIVSALGTTRQVRGRPTMIVAHTVKGKGISFMENDFNWHSKPLTDEHMKVALAELEEAAARI